jgi:hypothetical protein
MRAFLTILAMALVLTACSGTSNGPASSAGRAEPARAPRQIAGGAEADAAGKTTQSVALTSTQAIVYTADLTVRARDVTRAATEAKQIVAAAGGYVGGENATDDPGSHPSATITFKIPSARYAGVLDQLGSGRVGERQSLRQQADDVTQEVADVNSRVKSAQATLASFRDLLARAKTVGEVIRVEQEISSREADLESLQARQKALNAQTSYATVTLRVQGTTTTTTHRRHRKAGGFAGGASSGWHAFTTFLSGLALVFGWLLPFLALAALIGLPALWIWRRRRAASSDAT